MEHFSQTQYEPISYSHWSPLQVTEYTTPVTFHPTFDEYSQSSDDEHLDSSGNGSARGVDKPEAPSVQAECIPESTEQAGKAPEIEDSSVVEEPPNNGETDSLSVTEDKEAAEQEAQTDRTLDNSLVSQQVSHATGDVSQPSSESHEAQNSGVSEWPPLENVEVVKESLSADSQFDPSEAPGLTDNTLTEVCPVEPSAEIRTESEGVDSHRDALPTPSAAEGSLALDPPRPKIPHSVHFDENTAPPASDAVTPRHKGDKKSKKKETMKAKPSKPEKVSKNERSREAEDLSRQSKVEKPVEIKIPEGPEKQEKTLKSKKDKRKEKSKVKASKQNLNASAQSDASPKSQIEAPAGEPAPPPSEASVIQSPISAQTNETILLSPKTADKPSETNEATAQETSLVAENASLAVDPKAIESVGPSRTFEMAPETIETTEMVENVEIVKTSEFIAEAAEVTEQAKIQAHTQSSEPILDLTKAAEQAKVAEDSTMLESNEVKVTVNVDIPDGNSGTPDLSAPEEIDGGEQPLQTSPGVTQENQESTKEPESEPIVSDNTPVLSGATSETTGVEAFGQQDPDLTEERGLNGSFGNDKSGETETPKENESTSLSQSETISSPGPIPDNTPEPLTEDVERIIGNSSSADTSSVEVKAEDEIASSQKEPEASDAPLQTGEPCNSEIEPVVQTVDIQENAEPEATGDLESNEPAGDHNCSKPFIETQDIIEEAKPDVPQEAIAGVGKTSDESKENENSFEPPKTEPENNGVETRPPSEVEQEAKDSEPMSRIDSANITNKKPNNVQEANFDPESAGTSIEPPSSTTPRDENMNSDSVEGAADEESKPLDSSPIATIEPESIIAAECPDCRTPTASASDSIACEGESVPDQKALIEKEAKDEALGSKDVVQETSKPGVEVLEDKSTTAETIDGTNSGETPCGEPTEIKGNFQELREPQEGSSVDNGSAQLSAVTEIAKVSRDGPHADPMENPPKQHDMQDSAAVKDDAQIPSSVEDSSATAPELSSGEHAEENTKQSKPFPKEENPSIDTDNNREESHTEESVEPKEDMKIPTVEASAPGDKGQLQESAPDSEAASEEISVVDNQTGESASENHVGREMYGQNKEVEPGESATSVGPSREESEVIEASDTLLSKGSGPEVDEPTEDAQIMENDPIELNPKMNGGADIVRSDDVDPIMEVVEDPERNQPEVETKSQPPIEVTGGNEKEIASKSASPSDVVPPPETEEDSKEFSKVPLVESEAMVNCPVAPDNGPEEVIQDETAEGEAVAGILPAPEPLEDTVVTDPSADVISEEAKSDPTPAEEPEEDAGNKDESSNNTTGGKEAVDTTAAVGIATGETITVSPEEPKTITEEAIIDEPEQLQEVSKGQPSSPKSTEKKRHRSSRHFNSSSHQSSSSKDKGKGKQTEIPREGSHRPHTHRRRRDSEVSMSTATKAFVMSSTPPRSHHPVRHDSGVSAGSTSSHSHRKHRTPEEQTAHDKRKEERRARVRAAEEELQKNESAVVDEVLEDVSPTSTVPHRVSSRRYSSTRSAHSRDGGEKRPTLMDLKGISVVRSPFVVDDKPHIKEAKEKSKPTVRERIRRSIDSARPIVDDPKPRRLSFIDRIRQSIDSERPKLEDMLESPRSDPEERHKLEKKPPFDNRHSHRSHSSRKDSVGKEKSEKRKAEREPRRTRRENEKESERHRFVNDLAKKGEQESEERRIRREERREKRAEAERLRDSEQQQHSEGRTLATESNARKERVHRHRPIEKKGPAKKSLKSFWSSAKKVFI